jgi:hypothetical protein
MAKSVTLTQLQTDARLYSDHRPSGASVFINDTEITRLINLALGDLYDLLLAARGHEYYADEDTISVVSGTSRYNLPSDFYELLSAELEWGATNHEPVNSLEHVKDRYRLNNWATWAQGAPKAYRLRGAQIELQPTPTSAVTMRIQYVPALTDLAAPSATFDGVNGWEKLVALTVAKEMRVIQGQSFSYLDKLIDFERARIEAMAADRAASEPRTVRDVFPETNRIVPWFNPGSTETP